MGFSDAELYDKIRAANPNASPAAWQKMFEECKAASLNDAQKQIYQQYGNKYPSYGQMAIQNDYNNALTVMFESTSRGSAGDFSRTAGLSGGTYATNGVPDPSTQNLTQEAQQILYIQMANATTRWFDTSPFQFGFTGFKPAVNPTPVAPAKPKELAVVPTGKRTILFDEEI